MLRVVGVVRVWNRDGSAIVQEATRVIVAEYNPLVYFLFFSLQYMYLIYRRIGGAI